MGGPATPPLGVNGDRRRWLIILGGETFARARFCHLGPVWIAADAGATASASASAAADPSSAELSRPSPALDACSARRRRVAALAVAPVAVRADRRAASHACRAGCATVSIASTTEQPAGQPPGGLGLSGFAAAFADSGSCCWFWHAAVFAGRFRYWDSCADAGTSSEPGAHTRVWCFCIFWFVWGSGGGAERAEQ